MSCVCVCVISVHVHVHCIFVKENAHCTLNYNWSGQGHYSLNMVHLADKAVLAS